jgi:hypothetical protein
VSVLLTLVFSADFASAGRKGVSITDTGCVRFFDQSERTWRATVRQMREGDGSAVVWLQLSARGSASGEAIRLHCPQEAYGVFPVFLAAADVLDRQADRCCRRTAWRGARYSTSTRRCSATSWLTNVSTARAAPHRLEQHMPLPSLGQSSVFRDAQQRRRHDLVRPVRAKSSLITAGMSF